MTWEGRCDVGGCDVGWMVTWEGRCDVGERV